MFAPMGGCNECTVLYCSNVSYGLPSTFTSSFCIVCTNVFRVISLLILRQIQQPLFGALANVNVPLDALSLNSPAPFVPPRISFNKPIGSLFPVPSINATSLEIASLR